MKKMAVAVLCLSSVCLWMEGCGGTPGTTQNNTNNPPPTVTVNGAYTGSYTVSGQPATAVVGALAAGGTGYFADAEGNVFIFPAVPSTGTISGTVTGYAPPGQSFSSGQAIQTFTVSGTATGATGSAISGTLAGGGINASFTLASSTVTANSLAELAGNYTGVYTGSSQATLSLTVAADGTFTGFDSFGCSLTGSLALGADGLYTVAVSSAGSGCGGTYTGLGFASTADLAQAFSGAAGAYVYVGASNASTAFAAELKHQ